VKRLMLSLVVFASLAFAADASASDLLGVWRNPKNSVHVDIRPCGPSACGYVVWASPRAQADAKKGSGRDLIGLQLLQDFAPAGQGWRGKVFVPDLNRTLTGSARTIDVNHIEAKGCLIGSILCKAQVWTRLNQGES
jgi:uncharacterized protein (DUF2147 family)